MEPSSIFVFYRVSFRNLFSPLYPHTNYFSDWSPGAVTKISSFWVYAMISKQEIEQLGSPVGSVSLLFPVHEWKLSI